MTSGISFFVAQEAGLPLHVEGCVCLRHKSWQLMGESKLPLPQPTVFYHNKLRNMPHKHRSYLNTRRVEGGLVWDLVPR